MPAAIGRPEGAPMIACAIPFIAVVTGGWITPQKATDRHCTLTHTALVRAAIDPTLAAALPLAV